MEDEAKAAGSISSSQSGSLGGEEGPVREDQVQNAAQFLVHPKVQNSSMEERRKFLVKKGLTNKGMPDSLISLPYDGTIILFW
jgi:hypothetical protein